jgi:alpha-L-fucosidase
MSRLLAVLIAVVLLPRAARAVEPPAPMPHVPTPEQLAWQKLEFGMFCHFGINTFYDQEWGDGTEDPARFNPSEFDAEQWARVARECGMRYLVVTAKHHDGFCTYPTAYTDHSVKSSPWRGGAGDVVGEVADACRKHGLMFGFYLSPWDRHQPFYEDQPRYDAHFKNQIAELLTDYGPVGEVWFDGAGTEGHVYDWDGYYATIRAHQPGALIAICGPDIRWVGNEDGYAPETLWNVAEWRGEEKWYPAECDVPIRHGHWFWHPDADRRVKPLRKLLDIYYGSVGRGAVLLLNVAPDDRGLLPEADVKALRAMWAVIEKTFETNLAAGRPVVASNVRGGAPGFGPENALDGDYDTYWAVDDSTRECTIEVDLGGPVAFNRAMVQEYIPLGQRVERHEIHAWDGTHWTRVVDATTIGYKRLHRFDEVTASKERLVIRASKACPVINSFGIYRAE